MPPLCLCMSNLPCTLLVGNSVGVLSGDLVPLLTRLSSCVLETTMIARTEPSELDNVVAFTQCEQLACPVSCHPLIDSNDVTVVTHTVFVVARLVF